MFRGKKEDIEIFVKKIFAVFVLVSFIHSFYTFNFPEIIFLNKKFGNIISMPYFKWEKQIFQLFTYIQNLYALPAVEFLHILQQITSQHIFPITRKMKARQITKGHKMIESILMLYTWIFSQIPFLSLM